MFTARKRRFSTCDPILRTRHAGWADRDSVDRRALRAVRWPRRAQWRGRQGVRGWPGSRNLNVSLGKTCNCSLYLRSFTRHLRHLWLFHGIIHCWNHGTSSSPECIPQSSAMSTKPPPIPRGPQRKCKQGPIYYPWTSSSVCLHGVTLPDTYSCPQFPQCLGGFALFMFHRWWHILCSCVIVITHCHRYASWGVGWGDDLLLLVVLISYAEDQCIMLCFSCYPETVIAVIRLSSLLLDCICVNIVKFIFRWKRLHDRRA